MKLFYNKDGVVIGSVSGATEEIENSIKMPNTVEIKVPEELAARIDNPDDDLHPHDLTVENGEIIVPDTNTPQDPIT